MGGNSNSRLRAGVSGLCEWPGLLGSLQFLQGLEEFVSQCFIVLPEDASAGLHSDAPALCSHKHCFLGPPISFWSLKNALLGSLLELKYLCCL